MKYILLFIGTFIFCGQLFSQSIDKIINVAEVERIESALSHDSMQGRRTFTPGIDKAANFISSEFKKTRLKKFPGLDSFQQEFTVLRARPISAEGNFDGQRLDPKNIIALTSNDDLKLNNTSGYDKVFLGSGSNYRDSVLKYLESTRNTLVIIDTGFSRNFATIGRFAQQFFKKENNVVFVLSNIDPVNYYLHIKKEITEQKLSNVVGVIPGKSKRDEYVIFSAHYDHLGIGKPDAKGDSIYNGANDDAAGTTAVMMLAKYFKKLKRNKRTLIFIAFTAEEVGGYGSQYFSKQLNPDKIVAMFNIEMIGTESKWGANSAYITGFERSNLGTMLQTNLANSKFRFHPDPYPKQNLFFRSDNATLARLGVPAHTISTAKMEEAPNNEPNYHKQSDEIGTLEMSNMAEIIKAIGLSSKTIVSGNETPSRVINAKR